MNEILTTQEIKQRVLHELDVLSFLDLVNISYEELIDLVFENTDDEQRQPLEQQLLSS